MPAQSRADRLVWMLGRSPSRLIESLQEPFAAPRSTSPPYRAGRPADQARSNRLTAPDPPQRRAARFRASFARLWVKNQRTRRTFRSASGARPSRRDPSARGPQGPLELLSQKHPRARRLSRPHRNPRRSEEQAFNRPSKSGAQSAPGALRASPRIWPRFAASPEEPRESPAAAHRTC